MKRKPSAALDAAGAAVKARLVVGPYLAEFNETPEGLQAASAREHIRASRVPTIHPGPGFLDRPDRRLS